MSTPAVSQTLCKSVVGEAYDGCHTSWLADGCAGCLHELAALGYQFQARLRTEAVGGNERSVLAEAVARDESGVIKLARIALAQSEQVRDLGREESRLGVIGLLELVGGTLEANVGDGIAEGGVGGGVEATHIGMRSWMALPMPTTCEPWPGKPRPTRVGADERAHQLGLAPPPYDCGATGQAGAKRDKEDVIAVAFTRPWSTASQRAMGIEAAEVLPYLSMLRKTFSGAQLQALGDRGDNTSVGLVGIQIGYVLVVPGPTLSTAARRNRP